MSDDLYCKLYVQCHKEKLQVMSMIATIIGGRTSGLSEVIGPLFEIYVDVNDAATDGDPHDFLHFPYEVEIDPLDNVPRDHYVEGISSLIAGLSSLGFKSVPACSFEGEL